MRKYLMLTTAAILGVTTLAVSVSPADARSRHGAQHARQWRGSDGQTHCRRNDGTIGVVVGGVAGALVGRSIDTHGDRAVGTVVGAGAGALLGRAVVRKTTCR